MLRSKLLCRLVLAAIALGTNASAQDVKYEKYTLPNGLTVILHEDHSVPAACVNLWYYVASKDEAPGRSGFAHLFEHLMFMGTVRAPAGDFDTIMEGGGGFNNATTSEDRTNYFSMGPSELLPTLLWLDADRLEALGAAMTQEKLDKQRDVVRNERRQSYENQPYGKADLRISELMYPAGHPYHLPVIGSHEDLEAATVDDVKAFFATYYVPNNAGLVVAGDFDATAVKALVSDLFGSLPRGSDVVHRRAEPVALEGLVQTTMTDDVQFARTTIVYHSPASFAVGDAEMDLVAGILADGIASRLYQRLVYKQQLATEVTAHQESRLLGSLFAIEAMARPGVELATIENEIDAAIDELVATGPTREELEKQKAKLEHASMTRLQSLLGKADQLNTYQFHFDEPNSFKRDLDRYRHATAADVQRWARSVLNRDKRFILRVVPEVDEPVVNARDSRPAVEGTREFAPTSPTTFALSNGLKVHHWQRSELPLVELSLILPFGSTSDPANKAGVAALMADMLDEGTGDLDAISFANALDLLGARMEIDVQLEFVSIHLSALARNFPRALDLFSSAIRQPRFDDKEWQRVHDLHVQDLFRSRDEPTVVAREVGMRAFFGDAHPYRWPTDGTPTTAQAASLDDVRQQHSRIVRPQGAVILVAGDLTADGVKERLQAAFGDWVDPPTAPPVTPHEYPNPVSQALRVVVVDRPDAVQTVIRWVMPGIVYGDPTRLDHQLLNTILGGSFTSRLNQNLREQHGYTYGAGCRFTMQPAVGYLQASSNVRTDVTGASVREFLKEFRRLRGGDITPEEAKKARASERMDMIQAFAGLEGIIGSATTLVRNGRPLTDLGADLAAVANIDHTQLNRIAKSAIPLDQALLVLVGDRKAIVGQLDGLGLPKPVELDVDGEPVGPSGEKPGKASAN